MDAPLNEYEKIRELYTQYNADNFKTEHITYGVEWMIPTLDDTVWHGNGIEHQTLEMAKYIRNTMNTEHMKTRIVKYTKNIRREILDV
jgi:hypothetical protein